jgi:prepilin-type processing-associated H-X9-DG protein
MELCPNGTFNNSGREYPSYGYNYNLGIDATVVKLAAMQSPSETVLFGDSFAGLASPNDNLGYYIAYSPNVIASLCATCTQWWEMKPDATLAYRGRITQRHFDGANIAYADGHAKWSKLPGPLTQNDVLWDLN